MTQHNFAHLRARAFNTPLMLEPGYASHFFAYFGSRVGADELIAVDGKAISDLPTFAESYQNRRGRYNNDTGSYEPYNINAQGFAVISIEGSLVHKLGTLDPYSGMQGYDGITAKLEAAANDSRVRGVLIDMHSPGGEVSGVYEAAAAIKAFDKPIAAMANDMMTSAAYLLGSQADAIYASPTATVGSIGAVTAHYDVSEAMAAQGVRVTLISSGAHKVDGNPYEALPPEVYTEVKARLDASRKEFASAVVRGRNASAGDVKLSSEAILKTEAQIYGATQARDLGLIDHVMLPSGVAEHFSRQAKKGARPVRGANPSTKGKPKMDTNQENENGTEGMITEAAHKAGIEAAQAQGLADGKAQGIAEGATAERARINEIMSSEAATTRREFALKMATTTDMSAEQAIALLDAAPAEQAASAAAAAGTPELAALAQGASVPAASGSSVSTSEQRLNAAAERVGISLVS